MPMRFHRYYSFATCYLHTHTSTRTFTYFTFTCIQVFILWRSILSNNAIHERVAAKDWFLEKINQARTCNSCNTSTSCHKLYGNPYTIHWNAIISQKPSFMVWTGMKQCFCNKQVQVKNSTELSIHQNFTLWLNKSSWWFATTQQHMAKIQIKIFKMHYFFYHCWFRMWLHELWVYTGCRELVLEWKT